MTGGSSLRVALVMAAVGDLGGSGGAERHFADLYQFLSDRSNEGEGGRAATTLITARASLRHLQAAGKWLNSRDVVALPLGRRPSQGRINIAWMTLLLLWATIGRGFDVVHICLPTPAYVPFAALITRLPRSLRPRLAMTVIDCTLANNLVSNAAADLYEQQVVAAHRMYFRWTRLDGVYTWYEAFVSAARGLSLLPQRTLVVATKYCFTDPVRFRPASQKQPVAVFAGRLSTQKRPLMFVDAIASLRARHGKACEGWRFEMYGGGVQEAEVRRRIADHGLDGVITLDRTPDLSPVFGRTRLFVSTQAFENFTSLAMLEAMSAGNAVIAEDVGQTREFVRPGENGYLVDVATADGFADAMADYMRQPERHDAMAKASRALATDVHTLKNFAGDIADFWRRLTRASH